ncbi:hypothetical protein ATY30_28785 [Sinorhizobium americanum]|nr:hypothetical protein CO664_24545 [Sinorhizobium sp. NG07B]POH25039.1 hypothetical protein ATY30_28785 [Sinorhizobium americanum]
MQGLAKRNVIVTGAGSGIGRAIALRFARSGANVMAVGRTASKLNETAEFAKELPGKIAIFPADVTDQDAPRIILEKAIELIGGADALVNNVGRGNARAAHETTDESLRASIEVNFVSLFRMSREFISFKKQLGQGGSIVNISSIFGLMGHPGSSDYSAMKSAVIGLTRQMASDYGRIGIRVNAVAPGLIDTPAHTVERREEAKWFYKSLQGATPLQRSGSSDEIGGIVAFLCSDEASFLTGQVIAVDGGWSATKFVSESLYGE